MKLDFGLGGGVGACFVLFSAIETAGFGMLPFLFFDLGMILLKQKKSVFFSEEKKINFLNSSINDCRS